MTANSDSPLRLAPLSADDQRRLDEQGFVILEGHCSADRLERLRTRVDELYDLEGDQAGSEFRQEPGSRRLANLINKGEVFRGCAEDSAILPYINRVLDGSVKLSSVNARTAEPHNSTQPLHCDMGALPDECGNWVCNTVWMLDDFTEENGALRAVPCTHRSGKLPQDELDDLIQPHPDEVLITGKAGTVVVMNAHLWHGGAANRTDMPRRAVHAFYCRRDKPQQQYQKQLVDADIQASVSPDLRWILALDDPVNDEISRAPAERSGFLKA